jgi:hypothetical protein
MPCGGTIAGLSVRSANSRYHAANFRNSSELGNARLRTAEKLEADADRIASKLPSECWGADSS